MDKLTPFQEALLTAVLEDYTDIPKEELATTFEPTIYRKRSLFLRRSLITAAVVLVLAGSVFAAVRFGLQGSVKKSHYDNGTAMIDKFSISFEQAIAAGDAPDAIESFMLPATLSSADLSVGCYLEDENNAYHPYLIESDTNRPTDEKLQTTYVEWHVNDRYVSFSQMTAKKVVAGKPVLNVNVEVDKNILSEWSSFILGEQEIFCFQMDCSSMEECINENNPTIRMWFWTDGKYLYRLSCGIGFSDEEMLEIFESIAPVDDIYTYLGIK